MDNRLRYNHDTGYHNLKLSQEDTMSCIRFVEAFDDNYIWFIVDESLRLAIVIDPGQPGPVFDYLADHGLDSAPS